MIDVHSHILPAVDDGAGNLAEALEMARIAATDGVRVMLATPHHRDFGALPTWEVAERVGVLAASIAAADISLTVLPGHEVRLYPDVLGDWDRGLAGPLAGGPYVLAEPLFDTYDATTERLLFTLMDRGYTPILAHPERVRPLQANPALLEPFLLRGGLTQVTTTSVLGQGTANDYATAMRLLTDDMVHFLASDAHGPKLRPPGLSPALAVVADRFGAGHARRLVDGAQGHVLVDATVAA